MPCRYFCLSFLCFQLPTKPLDQKYLRGMSVNAGETSPGLALERWTSGERGHGVVLVQLGFKFQRGFVVPPSRSPSGRSQSRRSIHGSRDRPAAVALSIFPLAQFVLFATNLQALMEPDSRLSDRLRRVSIGYSRPPSCATGVFR